MSSQESKIYTFPKDFIFSCATSAFQVEGAADEDGKGPSIWDTYCRIPGNIKDNSNGNIACDSYHKYKEDVKLLKDLGVQQYRFSISWPRLLPDGTLRVINELGVDYYNKLIDELLINGIEPMITLFHWDLPQALQDLGGFFNPKIVDWFGNFARLCYEKFGDRVKKWITINEPLIIAAYGHGSDKKPTILAPGSFGANACWTRYLVGHHILLAHANAYHIYKNEFKSQQKGEVGITIVGPWCYALTENPEDVEAARRAFDFKFGWFANPIFHPDGDYPKRMKDRLLEKSKDEGRIRSRLPEFTKEEAESLKGSADFLGLNHYIGFRVRNRRPDEYTSNVPIDDLDGGFVTSMDPKWKQIDPPRGYVFVNPEALKKHLNYIKEEYGNPKVIITENGCMDHLDEGMNDLTRIEYVQAHLVVLAQAIEEGCNVIGYTLWSLMDNFEWAKGYTLRFGIYHIDFNDPELKRTPKASASWYKKVIKDRAINVLVEEDKNAISENFQREVHGGEI